MISVYDNWAVGSSLAVYIFYNGIISQALAMNYKYVNFQILSEKWTFNFLFFYVVSALRPQSSTNPRISNVPQISHITKQSFQRMKTDSDLRSSSTPDVHKHSPGSAPAHPRMPLLHRRQQHPQSSIHTPEEHRGKSSPYF